jgi:hypothetical protein
VAAIGLRGSYSAMNSEICMDQYRLSNLRRIMKSLSKSKELKTLFGRFFKMKSDNSLDQNNRLLERIEQDLESMWRTFSIDEKMTNFELEKRFGTLKRILLTLRELHKGRSSTVRA